jgi:hypothetical protein
MVTIDLLLKYSSKVTGLMSECFGFIADREFTVWQLYNKKVK